VLSALPALTADQEHHTATNQTKPDRLGFRNRAACDPPSPAAEGANPPASVATARGILHVDCSREARPWVSWVGGGTRVIDGDITT
jgi:hypothetical protein